MSSLSQQPLCSQHFMSNHQLVRVQLRQSSLALYYERNKLEVPLNFSVSFTTQSDYHGNLTSLTIYSWQMVQLSHKNPTVLEQWGALLQKMIHKVGFHQEYMLVANIGEGASGKVFLAKSLKDGNKVVAKAFSKKKMEGKEILALQNQINILRFVSCCHYFPSFIGSYQTQNNYYLLMEYAQGITLKEFILANRADHHEKKRILLQIGFAIKYLHKQQIAHRDIKPQNVIYNTRNGQIKIVDFGFAFSLRQKTAIFSNCGTAGYAPPQSLVKYYQPSLLGDIFSLGVLSHFMFTGSLPYRSKGSILIDTRDFKFAFSASLARLPTFLHLLKKMICPQSQRISIDEFIEHSFFKEHDLPEENPQTRRFCQRFKSVYNRNRGLSTKAKYGSKKLQDINSRLPRFITNLY